MQAWQQAPAVYVPQMGDCVVYLRDGHKEFLDATRDKRRPPWQLVLPSLVRSRRSDHSILPLTSPVHGNGEHFDNHAARLPGTASMTTRHQSRRIERSSEGEM